MQIARGLCVLGAAGLAAAAFADGLKPVKGRLDPTPRATEVHVGDDHLCVYPGLKPAKANEAGERLVTINETTAEPNGTTGTAVLLPLSPAEREVNVVGSLTSNDFDFFRVELSAGDLLNAAVVEPTNPDTRLAVVSSVGAVVFSNDDDNGQSNTIPASSPLLRTSGLNPNVAFVAPTTDTYYLRLSGFNSAETGPYNLQIRLRDGGVEFRNPGEKQIIFVDFDGETINAQSIFGTGNVTANLSPMTTFLNAWGLTNNAANSDAVIDGVMAKIEQNFEEMRAIFPDFDYELRNSRDDADPWGQPLVSRLIIGGTQSQLGIGTIGIAESIDPGNYEFEETAVILLDLLSSSGYSGSAQNIARAPGVSILESISRGVGNIAAHEAGHYLGLWHTVNTNSTPCLIDSGGGFIARNFYDSGPDNTIGNADDVESAFTTDTYAGEGIGESGSLENTGHRVAYALRATAACTGDFTGDNSVDGADLGILLGAWGQPGPTDLSGDGTTDGADLGLLLGAWGDC